MDKARLRQVLTDQQPDFQTTEGLIERDVDLSPFLANPEAVVITGIRRCGKSSLLRLIAKRIDTDALFVNFEDVRFTAITTDNFGDLEDFAIQRFGTKPVTFFLDEVQTAPGWERWVNTLHAKHVKVFLTGSNSTLLSPEISTHLTGRHRPLRLFPFSFKEFLRLKNRTIKPEPTSREQSLLLRSFQEYLALGGFPLVLTSGDAALSRQYFEDILTKDILGRYRIRQAKELKDLALYLMSNTGRPYAYSTLRQVTGVKSPTTLRQYIDHCREAYLLYTIERFDYSLRRQKVSSAKPYAGDLGFLRTVAFATSENLSQQLENAVFLHLLRQNKQVYYHLDKTECDFVVKEGLRITEAIQVCADLTHPQTRKRELEGLRQAMAAYRLQKGRILTLEQEDTFSDNGRTILVTPVWKWLLE